MFSVRLFHLSRTYSCKMLAKSTFKSFIFLDLETTGLQRPVEITELCLIAVQRQQILRRVSSNGKNFIPRLLDKLTLCVRPVQEIESGAQAMTGISCEDLEQHRRFDNGLAQIVLSFILRQPQPSCLVAHSGDRFDFEILASEFTEVGVEFPSSIHASDSYKAFKGLHEATRSPQTHGKIGPKMSNRSKRVSFSLGNLYTRHVEKDFKGCHTAEGDTIALLELVVAKPEVLEYIEDGAHPMGCGVSNSGLKRVRDELDKDNKDSYSQEEIDEVHDDYFHQLEEEGILDIEGHNNLDEEKKSQLEKKSNKL